MTSAIEAGYFHADKGKCLLHYILHTFISSVNWLLDTTVLFGQQHPCVTVQDKQKDYRNQRDKWVNINRMAKTELSI